MPVHASTFTLVLYFTCSRFCSIICVVQGRAACDKASSRVMSGVFSFVASLLLSYAPLYPLPNWFVMIPERVPMLLFSRL